MEIVILEGCRGTGKSTLAFKLRQKTSPTPTLINFTGFHDDGEQGLSKVHRYYYEWLEMFWNLRRHESQYIFDRFYFSEMVYSQLYKDYSFKDSFWEFSDWLHRIACHEGVRITIFNLTINDEDELRQRLIRDKVPFGKAEESVEQSLKQQELYKNMFNDMVKVYSGVNGLRDANLQVHIIDTSNKTTDEVYAEIVKQLETT